MKVSIVRTADRYPEPPFSPSEAYPEYPFSAGTLSGAPNTVYPAVRSALCLAGLDTENFGRARWNPFGDLVSGDGTVVLKPNFVNHFNPMSDDRPHLEALVTQGAVIRAVADYVLLAGGERLRVVIADLPIQSADFDRICVETGVDHVVRFLDEHSGPGVCVDLLDLRDYRLVTDDSGAIVERVDQPADPRGLVTVDLGRHSALRQIERDSHLFRAPDYRGDATVRMHADGHHQYIIPRTILECRLLINIPKLKVHRKVGATLSMKNLVGIIGDKSCLPHWRAGSPENGGDEYPVDTLVRRLRSRYDLPLRTLGGLAWKLARPLGRKLSSLDARNREAAAIQSSGDWYGNDTCWRMVHDLNRVILYADSNGTLQDVPQRKYFAVVDGIVGGEGDGPLKPIPVPAGVILCGSDPVAVDLVGSTLMGFDWRRIPLIREYRLDDAYPFSSFSGDAGAVKIVESLAFGEGSASTLSPLRSFAPAPGWVGHIELPGPMVR